MAGVTYTEYGYYSNTVIAAVSIVLMALLVRYLLPEPGLKAAQEASSETPKVAGAS